MPSALEQTTGDIDRQCELLAAQGQFIEAIGLENWPDGTLTGHYRFHHPLYLEVARGHVARSLELRTALGLCRIWVSQGQPDEARKLLEPLYASFSEGLETEDLQAARSVLDELA